MVNFLLYFYMATVQKASFIINEDTVKAFQLKTKARMFTVTMLTEHCANVIIQHN